jgi:hypothetical protein
LNIIAAILRGERDPVKPSQLVDRRVRATPTALQKALRGIIVRSICSSCCG